MITETIQFVSLASSLDSRAARLLTLINEELTEAKRVEAIDHSITTGTLADTLRFVCAL